MASFLKRAFTSCSITSACSGPTSVGMTPLKGSGGAPNRSLVLQCAGPIETHLAVVSTLPNSLLREPVSRDWPLVRLELLARCPEAEDRQGTAALAALETSQLASQFRYVSGWERLREVLAGDHCALEHWQGWQTDLLRALRRDGHRVMRCTPLFPRGACPHKS